MGKISKIIGHKTSKKSVKKIIVIDDDLGILDAIKLTLEDKFEVKTIFKGEDALKKVIEFLPDLIILDVLMSGKDGREICKNLKINEKTRLIPVVMISAHPSAENSISECGAEDFLAKPFEVEELVGKINKFI